MITWKGSNAHWVQCVEVRAKMRADGTHDRAGTVFVFRDPASGAMLERTGVQLIDNVAHSGQWPATISSVVPRVSEAIPNAIADHLATSTPIMGEIQFANVAARTVLFLERVVEDGVAYFKYKDVEPLDAPIQRVPESIVRAGDPALGSVTKLYTREPLSAARSETIPTAPHPSVAAAMGVPSRGAEVEAQLRDLTTQTRPFTDPLPPAVRATDGTTDLHFTTINGQPSAIRLFPKGTSPETIADAAKLARASSFVELPDGRIGFVTEALPMKPFAAIHHLNTDPAARRLWAVYEELHASGRDIRLEDLRVNSAAQIWADPALTVPYDKKKPLVDLNKATRELREATY